MAKKAALSDHKVTKPKKTQTISGKFGQIGDIPFVMSYDYDAHDGQVQMLNSYTRTDTSRVSEISYINGKPKTQYNGAARATGSFGITLATYLGVDVVTVAKQLRSYAQKGTALRFVIGGKSAFKRKVRITSVDESFPYFTPDGKPLQIDCTVNVEEV